MDGTEPLNTICAGKVLFGTLVLPLMAPDFGLETLESAGCLINNELNINCNSSSS